MLTLNSKTGSVNIVIKFFDNFIYDILITYTLFLTHPITTFCSSVIQLTIQDKAMDSNVHILLRLAICFLGVSFIYLFNVIKLKNIIIQELVSYIISLIIILLFVYCLDFFVEIGEKPPYPVFAINYTGVYIVITVFMYFNKKKKLKDN